MPEVRTFRVALISADASHSVDSFYKYRSERLQEVGQIIGIVRFVRGRVIRARVTRVDPRVTPPIEATQIV
jgi:hypothetical protein